MSHLGQSHPQSFGAIPSTEHCFLGLTFLRNPDDFLQGRIKALLGLGCRALWGFPKTADDPWGMSGQTQHGHSGAGILIHV